MFDIIIYAALAVLLIFTTVSYFKNRRVFSERGIRVPATVTHVNLVRVRKGTVREYTMEYMVEGGLQTAKCRAGSRHEVGEAVELAYLPESPEQIMLTEDFADTTANSMKGFLRVAMCVFFVVLLAINAPRILKRSESFIEFCRRGTPEQVKAKIEAGAAVNVRDKDFNTPLISAARDNTDPEVLRLLVQAGAVYDKDFLLSIAAQHNRNPEVSRALIQDGADVNAKSFMGWTPLREAAYRNSNPEVSRALIQAGADVNAKDGSGTTPLMCAALFRRSPEVLNALIQAGADVNAKDNDGRTALSLAVKTREPIIVSLLLASGAAVSENDVELAQKNEHLKDTAIIEELRQKLKK